MVLQHQRYDDSYGTDAATNPAALKEAFHMNDSFSAGGVFYGRTLAIVGGIMVLAVLLNLI
jgi:hypothetical protein